MKEGLTAYLVRTEVKVVVHDSILAADTEEAKDMAERDLSAALGSYSEFFSVTPVAVEVLNIQEEVDRVLKRRGDG